MIAPSILTKTNMGLLEKAVNVPVMVVLSCCALLGVIYLFVEAKKSFSPAPEVFVGASPCDQSVRPMIAVPVNSECEMVKWQLSLFKNPENDTPIRFELKYTYGMTKPGTQGFLNDGTSAAIEGK